MNAYKFEEALRKINATRGFLRLLCAASAETAGLCDLEQYYDLFDFIETTCGAGLEELEEMSGGAEPANQSINQSINLLTLQARKRGEALYNAA